MYAYFKGKLAYIGEDSIILDVHDVGYRILLSPASIAYLPQLGEEVQLYTYTSVREDAIWLYGFLSHEDLEIFKKCITVSGIGPKGGMAILSVMDAEALRFAIISGDAKAISKAPGIGMKTAQRLILELKDKISVEETLVSREVNGIRMSAGIQENNSEEAVEALVALGYSASDALKAVKSVENAAEMDVEALLKAALKNMF
ncbi:MAG: Holliday junction branch migration protein RuvA [Roseburia sp.]|nr:Holliday junction branch migration protein RuvA [Roseburia sp.]